MNDICLPIYVGMHAGLPKFVPVNLKDIEDAGFNEGDEVSLESLKAKGLINPSGRERRLPLKVLSCLLPILLFAFECSLANYIFTKKDIFCRILGFSCWRSEFIACLF